jgi:hypothetical protein
MIRHVLSALGRVIDLLPALLLLVPGCFLIGFGAVGAIWH